MDRWSGKVVVVTGASSGIGRSVSTLLAKHGMKVVALGRRKENLDKLANDIKGCKGCIKPYKCDIRNSEEIKSAFEYTEKNIGPVSVLINNAGVLENIPLNEAKLNDAVKVIETNVVGLINCVMEATSIMKKHGIDEGHIINVNSVVGHQVIPRKGLGVYTASKYAVSALTECLKNDLALDKSKVKVTSISPGLVETEMTASYIKTAPTSPKLQEKDIADCILFVLQTPKNVNISEMTIQAVGECFGVQS